MGFDSPQLCLGTRSCTRCSEDFAPPALTKYKGPQMTGRTSVATPPPVERARRTKLPERNLDVLRAVAVLLVFADHIISAVGHHSESWNWNWSLGRIGGAFFFVHTSLVL